LRIWMAGLSGEPLPKPDVPPPEPEVVPYEPDSADPSTVFQLQQVLSELVNLMVGKKVISELEGTALLRKIFR
jgi:hypothetical protein